MIYVASMGMLQIYFLQEVIGLWLYLWCKEEWQTETNVESKMKIFKLSGWGIFNWSLGIKTS